jgi:TonB family protein
MSIAEELVGILILATSICAFAQTTETKPPDAKSAANAMDQVEILTDTMGVDFKAYLTKITEIVRQNWYTLMPESVYPPIFKQGKVSIEFNVLKDGKVDGMTLHTSSGDVGLDRAAQGSIIASMPFPQLPEEFPGKLIGLRFYYHYNPNRDSLWSGHPLNLCNLGVTTISISPCVDVRVPASSTLKFVASGKDITDESVTWSVSGKGCTNSSCGTISASGLYTAPVEIPSPPIVIVKATSRTDGSITSTSEVTVVQANPPH